MNKTYANILAAASYKEFDKLKKIYYNLLFEKENMNRFFSEFLKVADMQEGSPYWITYNKKWAEYGELDYNIKVAKFYMEKAHV